jgi:hypothetical protein
VKRIEQTAQLEETYTLFTPTGVVNKPRQGTDGGASGTWRTFSSSRLSRRNIAAAAIFWCATLLLLYLSGSFTHEFGGAPDEAAHFVTGLMIHDYVVSGIGTPPFEFAKEYYIHYPKVAFGIWPPLFHFVEAAWMLLISPAKASVIVMLSIITTMLAYLLFLVVKRAFGYAAGLGAGVLLVTVPLVQESTSLVMVDTLVALFSFLAIIRFGRYLDSGHWKDAALFGMWASAAILSKYNGLALAFVPPLCVVLTRRWKLLFRRSTLLPAVIVCVICGSWYLPMWRLIAYAAEPLPSLGTIVPAMKANTIALMQAMGVPVLIVAAIGMALVMRRAPIEKRGTFIAAAAFVIGCWLFHSLTIPEPEPRYMVSTVAPLILFLTVGIYNLSRRLNCRPVLLAAGITAAYAAGSFTVIRTPHLGYAEVASAITRPGQAREIILTVGTPEREGMAVSEIAMRDRRPGHYVLRGSKVLATSTWVGTNYRPLYETAEQVLQGLDKIGASTVILQADAPAGVPHHRLLSEALQSAPSIWSRWSDGAWASHEQHVLVYRRIHPIRGPFCVELSLQETLHRRMNVCIPEPDKDTSAAFGKPAGGPR